MKQFEVDTIGPAIVTIDMPRAHLDHAVATLPVAPETEAGAMLADVKFLHMTRASRASAVHMPSQYPGPCEARMSASWRTCAVGSAAARKHALQRQIKKDPDREIMPRILDKDHDTILKTTYRYDHFQSTKPEPVLHTRSVNMAFSTRINADRCVLTTLMRANLLGFTSRVLEDDVDTLRQQYFARGARCQDQFSIACPNRPLRLVQLHKARQFAQGAEASAGAQSATEVEDLASKQQETPDLPCTAHQRPSEGCFSTGKPCTPTRNGSITSAV